LEQNWFVNCLEHCVDDVLDVATFGTALILMCLHSVLSARDVSAFCGISY
jgi:hypothetical protein